MLTLKLCPPPLVVAVVLSLATVTAFATPITIPNASFESPSSPTESTTNFSLLPGWTFVPQKNAEFGTDAISSYFTSPGAASGNNFVFIQNDESTSSETITSAASLGKIMPLTQYTLTVAIGNVKGADSAIYGAPGPVAFSLLGNGATLATQTVANGTIPNNTFEDFSLTYLSPASGSVIGENLTIQLAAKPESGWFYQAAFDDVTLDATAVPEPPTRWLVIYGALALCLVRRRRIP